MKELRISTSSRRTTLELEKSVINLGSAISESDESENVQLTEEQIAELKAAREEKTSGKKKQ